MIRAAFIPAPRLSRALRRALERLTLEEILDAAIAGTLAAVADRELRWKAVQTAGREGNAFARALRLAVQKTAARARAGVRPPRQRPGGRRRP